MPLNSVPDMALRAAEIDDPKVLLHRVLYRHGRISQLFGDGEPRPLGERKQTLGFLTGSNRADLYRLEELLDTIRAQTVSG
jgi:hypothetical protein